MKASPGILGLFLGSMLLQGCYEERPIVPHPSAEYVVLVDAAGNPDNVLLEQFFKQKEFPQGTKILALDKRKNQQVFIDPADILKQNPNTGRYVIFKHDDPGRSFDDLPEHSTTTATESTP